MLGWDEMDVRMAWHGTRRDFSMLGLSGSFRHVGAQCPPPRDSVGTQPPLLTCLHSCPGPRFRCSKLFLPQLRTAARLLECPHEDHVSSQFEPYKNFTVVRAAHTHTHHHNRRLMSIGIAMDRYPLVFLPWVLTNCLVPP